MPVLTLLLPQVAVVIQQAIPKKKTTQHRTKSKPVQRVKSIWMIKRNEDKKNLIKIKFGFFFSFLLRFFLLVNLFLT